MKKWIQKRASSFHRAPESMRGFYDRIHSLYGLVEWHLSPGLDEVVDALAERLDLDGGVAALEYACGSGLLTLKLAPHVNTITARDLSPKMLKRAKRRSAGVADNILFQEGNILEIGDADMSFDYGFVSFALHLFGPEEQANILKELLRVCKKQVIIVEHIPKWQLSVALVEWAEGSHYNEFINMDWRKEADGMGCSFSREIIGGCQVQFWG